jgi:hypothetical protein
METTGNISINVFEKNKDKIEKSSNASEAFLILSNEELNNQNRNFIIEIENLKSQNETLEEQNEKMETSTRYMRGILHNFTEKVKHQDKVIKYYKSYHSSLKDFSKSINSLVKKINDFIKKFAIIYNLILMVLCFMDSISWVSIITHNIIAAMGVGITIAFTQLDYTLILHIEDKTKSINEIQKRDKNLIDIEINKISEIDKSNNFIEDYIEVV